MKKVVFYELYYFEDKRRKAKYYCDDKSFAEKLRFMFYKAYDGERISTRNFVVPVSHVKKVLVSEEELNKIRGDVITAEDFYNLTPKKRTVDFLFDNMFDKKVEFCSKKENKRVRGNARLSSGLFRTTDEQEQYLQESLERKLP